MGLQGHVTVGSKSRKGRQRSWLAWGSEVRTQLQGLEVKAEGVVSDAEGAGQGRPLEGSSALVPLHGCSGTQPQLSFLSS